MSMTCPHQITRARPRKGSSLRLIIAMTMFTSTLTLAQLAAAADPDEADAGSESNEGEVVITDKARAHFKAGVNLLQDPEGARYEEAYYQFKAAYAESPSWKILGNLGLAAMRLERYGEAIDAFTKHLEEGADTLGEQEQQQFRRDLETLQASYATLDISGPPGATLTDLRSSNSGDDMKNFYIIPETGELSLRVRPGQHQITAESEGKSLGSWSVRIESGKLESHEFSIDDPEKVDTSTVEPALDSTSESSSNSTRIPAYAALGVGAVGVGLGVVFAVMHSGHKKKGDEQYDGCVASGTCGGTEQESIEDRDKKAASAGTMSMISFGVGAVGIGTGLALLLMGGGGDERPLEAQVGRMSFSPYASHRQFGLEGTF